MSDESKDFVADSDLIIVDRGVLACACYYLAKVRPKTDETLLRLRRAAVHSPVYKGAQMEADLDAYERLCQSKDVRIKELEAAMAVPGLHPATAELVHRFAVALAQKLAVAEKKYGYGNNWVREGWMDECRAELMRHISKGDPRDVAAYCAFLWHHGAPTAAPVADPAPLQVEEVAK